MTIRATLNYFAAGVPRGRFDLVDPRRNLMPLEPHEVAIRDMRAPGETPSLEEHGFMLARHSSAVARSPAMTETNLTAQHGLPAVNAAYYDELVPLIAEVTGARDVLPQAAGLAVRFSARSQRQSWAGAAGFIHLDLTTGSMQRFLDATIAGAGRQLAPWRRVVVIQSWRVLSDPPQDNLLALVDRRSVPPSDIVFYDAVMGGGDTLDQAEARSIRYRPDHRWWYASDMRADDVLLFVGYDSADPEAVQPAHTGFDVPGNEHAAPRASLEARFFAFYE